jgi:hypothetical protein
VIASLQAIRKDAAVFTALRRTFALFAVPAVVATAVLAPTASALPLPQTQPGGISAPPTTVAVPTTGIIMRDGGVCDPIRHMGC